MTKSCESNVLEHDTGSEIDTLKLGQVSIFIENGAFLILEPICPKKFFKSSTGFEICTLKLVWVPIFLENAAFP